MHREAPPPAPNSLRVTHVVDSLGRGSGGPSYSVPSLCRALARSGADVHLRAIESAGIPALATEGRSIHRVAADPIRRAVRASPELLKALSCDARAGAVLHTHGLWLMSNVYPAWAVHRSRGAAKLVHAPRGMLGRDALDISAWKKKPFWRLLQRSALAGADCLHATAGSEYEEIRAAGLTSPVAIIPNGIDLVDLAIWPRHQQPGRVALSLGRLHPKKGLDRLVRAWTALEHAYPEWSLRIIGPSELNHDTELCALAKSLGAQRISVEQPVYGDGKFAAFRAADFFVMPTLNENFGMTVAEALVAEVPVISTKGAPWSGLETERCGWWIDHGVEPLEHALRIAMAFPQDDLRAMGARGRRWMASEFDWDKISQNMLDVYRWLIKGGEPPTTVRLD